MVRLLRDLPRYLSLAAADLLWLSLEPPLRSLDFLVCLSLRFGPGERPLALSPLPVPAPPDPLALDLRSYVALEASFSDRLNSGNVVWPPPDEEAPPSVRIDAARCPVAELVALVSPLPVVSSV